MLFSIAPIYRKGGRTSITTIQVVEYFIYFKQIYQTVLNSKSDNFLPTISPKLPILALLSRLLPSHSNMTTKQFHVNTGDINTETCKVTWEKGNKLVQLGCISGCFQDCTQTDCVTSEVCNLLLPFN